MRGPGACSPVVSLSMVAIVWWLNSTISRSVPCECSCTPVEVRRTLEFEFSSETSQSYWRWSSEPSESPLGLTVSSTMPRTWPDSNV